MYRKVSMVPEEGGGHRVSPKVEHVPAGERRPAIRWLNAAREVLWAALADDLTDRLENSPEYRQAQLEQARYLMLLNLR